MTIDVYPYACMADYHHDLAALDAEQNLGQDSMTEYFALQDENHKYYLERIGLVLEVSQN